MGGLPDIGRQIRKRRYIIRDEIRQVRLLRRVPETRESMVKWTKEARNKRWIGRLTTGDLPQLESHESRPQRRRHLLGQGSSYLTVFNPESIYREKV